MSDRGKNELARGFSCISDICSLSCIFSNFHLISLSTFSAPVKTLFISKRLYFSSNSPCSLNNFTSNSDSLCFLSFPQLGLMLVRLMVCRQLDKSIKILDERSYNFMKTLNIIHLVVPAVSIN